MDRLSIGSTPCEESCEQLGTDYNPSLAKLECEAFIGMLKRVHGDPPEGVRFKVAANPHDFGTYYEVEVIFQGDNEASANYAYDCEGNKTPSTWDDLAMMFIDRHRARMGEQPMFGERLTTMTPKGE